MVVRSTWPLVPAAALVVTAASFLAVVLCVVGYAFVLAIAHGGVVESARLDAFADALGERLGPALRVLLAFVVARRLAAAGRLGAMGAAAFAAVLVVFAAGIAALFGDAPTATDVALAAATFVSALVGQRLGMRDHVAAIRERALLVRLRGAANADEVARALGEHAGDVAFDLWAVGTSPPTWLAGSDGEATAALPPVTHWIACGDAHGLALRRDDTRARRRLASVADAIGVALERVVLQRDARRRGERDARERLAGDIHDTIAQDLGAASAHLEAAIAAQAERGGGAADHLGIAARSVRSALGELRGLVWALRPSERRLPLVAALRRAIDRIAAATDVRVHAELPDVTPPMSSDAELCVLRALQEGLHNAVRHGGATRVDVALTETGDGVQLAVIDDGSGCDPTEAGAPDGDGGHGLSLLRERTLRLGGTLELHPVPDGGCRLRLRLPSHPVAP